MKCFSRRALTVLALPAGVGVLAAVPAVAAAKTNVRCVGSADFCGAKVSIAGGASNRIVMIGLAGTNLKLVGVSAIPGQSREAFGISKGGVQARRIAVPLHAQRSAVKSAGRAHHPALRRWQCRHALAPAWSIAGPRPGEESAFLRRYGHDGIDRRWRRRDEAIARATRLVPWRCWPFAEYQAQCGSFDQGLTCTKSSEGLEITRR
jgi:hypothetical protein